MLGFSFAVVRDTIDKESLYIFRLFGSMCFFNFSFLGLCLSVYNTPPTPTSTVAIASTIAAATEGLALSKKESKRANIIQRR
jgi:hypothetical protein